MSNPLISVLITTYNCGAFIDEAIQSVLSQSFRDYEIIVVDDGSDDGTENIVKKYPGISYHRHDHMGIPETRNKAISLARGQWIAFLDADDIWLPEKLSRQMAYLREHRDCRIVYTEIKNFCDIPPENRTEEQNKLLCSQVKQSITTALIHQSLFETVGLFDESLPYGEDTEWNMRAGILGIDMTCEIPEQLHLRRIHQNNISLTNVKQNDSRERLKIMACVIRKYRKRNRTE